MSSALLATPIPRGLKLPGPYALPSSGCALFRGDVVERVCPVRQGVTLADQPSPKVPSRNRADRDDAAIPICVSLPTANGVAADEVRQGEGRFLAAAVFRSAGRAELIGFGCVNAVQPDAPPVNFNGVAVNHGCDSHELARRVFVAASNETCRERGSGDPSQHARPMGQSSEWVDSSATALARVGNDCPRYFRLIPRAVGLCLTERLPNGAIQPSARRPVRRASPAPRSQVERLGRWPSPAPRAPRRIAATLSAIPTER